MRQGSVIDSFLIVSLNERVHPWGIVLSRLLDVIVLEKIPRKHGQTIRPYEAGNEE